MNKNPTADFRQLYASFTLTNNCNMKCDYCYVKRVKALKANPKPEMMGLKVVKNIAEQLADYCEQNSVKEVMIQLYGGEPLMFGKNNLRLAVAEIRSSFENRSEVFLDFILQTNATLLNQDWIDTLNQVGVSIGISLDSPAATHNLHRKFPDGSGSYFKVSKNIEILQHATAKNRVFRWLLSVIDINSDPTEAFRHLADFNLNNIEFIFPVPAKGKLPPGKKDPNDPVYADWLIPIFDQWLLNDIQHIRVRPFDAMMRALTENKCFLDFIVTDHPFRSVFFQTDGSYTTDKPAGPHKAKKKRWMINENHLSETMGDWDEWEQYSNNCFQPPKACLSCRYLVPCRGEDWSYRRGPGGNYNNIKLYCADLKKLFSHIETAIHLG